MIKVTSKRIHTRCDTVFFCGHESATGRQRRQLLHGQLSRVGSGVGWRWLRGEDREDRYWCGWWTRTQRRGKEWQSCCCRLGCIRCVRFRNRVQPAPPFLSNTQREKKKKRAFAANKIGHLSLFRTSQLRNFVPRFLLGGERVNSATKVSHQFGRVILL